jgi:hypothetical protein
MVTKDQLGVEKVFPPRTHKFLCNAPHMPSHLGPNAAFPFECPICAKQYKNRQLTTRTSWKALRGCNSSVCVTKCTSILPSSPLSPRTSTFICTLHMLMGSQKHVWRHGISDDIAGRGAAGEAKVIGHHA